MDKKIADKLKDIHNILEDLCDTEKGIDVAMMIGYLEIVKNAIFMEASRKGIKNLVMESKE